MSNTKFPRASVEILDLGREMVAGFTANPKIYPGPPIEPAELTNQIAAYVKARDALLDAQVLAKQAQENRDETLETLVSSMKSDIRYAENAVDYDDGKLHLIGWSGRRPNSSLSPPGQVRDLVSPDRGAGWIEFHWKAPPRWREGGGLPYPAPGTGGGYVDDSGDGAGNGGPRRESGRWEEV